jgi:hypothetical protein
LECRHEYGPPDGVVTIADYLAIGILIVLFAGALANGSARQVMIRAIEYKHNAQECRKQAKGMLRAEDRNALERIAQVWERLANLRKRHPQLELEPETVPERVVRRANEGIE